VRRGLVVYTNRFFLVSIESFIEFNTARYFPVVSAFLSSVNVPYSAGIYHSATCIVTSQWQGIAGSILGVSRATITSSRPMIQSRPKISIELNRDATESRWSTPHVDLT